MIPDSALLNNIEIYVPFDRQGSRTLTMCSQMVIREAGILSVTLIRSYYLLR